MGGVCRAAPCGAGGAGASDAPRGGMGSDEAPETLWALERMSDAVAAASAPFESKPVDAADGSRFGKAFSTGEDPRGVLALLALWHVVRSAMTVESVMAIALPAAGLGTAALGAHAMTHPAPRFAYTDQPTEGAAAPQPVLVDQAQASSKFDQSIRDTVTRFREALARLDLPACEGQNLDPFMGFMVDELRALKFDHPDYCDSDAAADMIRHVLTREAVDAQRSTGQDVSSVLLKGFHCIEEAQRRYANVRDVLTQAIKELMLEHGPNGSNLGLDWMDSLRRAQSPADAAHINQKFMNDIQAAIRQRLSSSASSTAFPTGTHSIEESLRLLSQRSTLLLSQPKDPTHTSGELHYLLRHWAACPWL